MTAELMPMIDSKPPETKDEEIELDILNRYGKSKFVAYTHSKLSTTVEC